MESVNDNDDDHLHFALFVSLILSHGSPSPAINTSVSRKDMTATNIRERVYFEHYYLSSILSRERERILGYRHPFVSSKEVSGEKDNQSLRWDCMFGM